ncbi:MAG: CPBP family glutamic-type intramembrane protease [Micropruina sp.]
MLASLLFGLAHRQSPVGAGLAGWALWTTVAGLLFGYIRAKAGSFVASGIVHGVLPAVSAVFTPGP